MNQHCRGTQNKSLSGPQCFSVYKMRNNSLNLVQTLNILLGSALGPIGDRSCLSVPSKGLCNEQNSPRAEGKGGVGGVVRGGQRKNPGQRGYSYSLQR